MTGVAEITDALKRCLKSRGMTYAQLAKALGLSEASVKRLFSGGGFTLRRVEQICRVLDIDLFELARLAHSEAAAVTELTVSQEQALAGRADSVDHRRHLRQAQPGPILPPGQRPRPEAAVLPVHG